MPGSGPLGYNAGGAAGRRPRVESHAMKSLEPLPAAAGPRAGPAPGGRTPVAARPPAVSPA
jgi:hypothetical protein